MSPPRQTWQPVVALHSKTFAVAGGNASSAVWSNRAALVQANSYSIPPSLPRWPLWSRSFPRADGCSPRWFPAPPWACSVQFGSPAVLHCLSLALLWQRTLYCVVKRERSFYYTVLTHESEEIKKTFRRRKSQGCYQNSQTANVFHWESSTSCICVGVKSGTNDRFISLWCHKGHWCLDTTTQLPRLFDPF